MKISGSYTSVLIALQFVCLGWAYSQDLSSPKITEEISKQESIYHSQGDQRPDGYTVNRSLLNYLNALPSGFDSTLASLDPKDRWLDIGAGEGLAILDYYNPNYDFTMLQGRKRRGNKAQAVAISIEDRRTLSWQIRAASLAADQMRYLSGRRLQDYSSEELGRFQMITDVFGGFSYTRYLSLFMEKALSFLALGGSFYTLLQDVHSEAGTNKPLNSGARFRTEIATGDGSEVRICSWLKSITCVEVTCELKPRNPLMEIYSIRKICDQVKVPPLELMDFQAGTPPARQFLMGH